MVAALEKLLRDFLWEGSNKEGGCHLVACCPKNMGGLVMQCKKNRLTDLSRGSVSQC